MKKIGLSFLACIWSFCTYAQSYIQGKNQRNAFPIVESKAAPIYVDASDHWLVQKAAALFQTDVAAVTGMQPDTAHTLPTNAKNIIVIGSLNQSPIINELVATRHLTITGIQGKWEAFQIQVVAHPFPNVDKALVIAGSDKRGTAYGVFELSKQIGVSPWYWWADVPVKKQPQLWYNSQAPQCEAPGVTYRGIFINDEAPALSEWSKATFGGFNHLFYEKVFELLLRLKGNYLWPAMWGSAFYDDDTLNPVLADKYGIVIGTSHHEPMLRAHDEWRRYGKGKWNYDSNENRLKAFWTEGIRRNRHYESTITVGMRGDGDEPMSPGSNISLLERIIADQRNIIASVTGKEAKATPQLWALYKEVQDYYDKGMRVPDDVTLLLCDDNWGNIRKLPNPNAPKRAGGYGLYYHFDYVGGPRNYKWLNTNSISRTWEQLHLAWNYGVNRIWIVNVGDIKPMELPTSFFLDYAWNPNQYTGNVDRTYTYAWAEQQFGRTHAAAIARLLSAYTQYNSRRKPELLSPDTYSLLHYREAETIVQEYNALAQKADSLYALLPANYKDAFYQLVLYPVKACANLNDLYVTAAKNHLYAKQGRAATNDLANRCRQLFMTDSLLSYTYNHQMANGKWNHMMDQTHIGYTRWQQPPVNKMPAVSTITNANEAVMGVAVEGSEAAWPADAKEAVLPAFDMVGNQQHYIEVFNSGTVPFNYTIKASEPWVQLSSQGGRIEKETRIWVTINKAKAPMGTHRIAVTITGPHATVTVYVVIDKKQLPQQLPNHFIESNGYIAIAADDYTKAINDSALQWYRIDAIGRTGNGITTTIDTTPIQHAAAHLEYNFYSTDTGTVAIQLYCSPTLPFNESNGLRMAVSFDNEPPQMLNIHADNSERAWAQSVSDNIRIATATLRLHKAGNHILKYWYIDPGIVLQKLVINWGGAQSCYLGPPTQGGSPSKGGSPWVH